MYEVEKVFRASKPDAVYRTVKDGAYPQIQNAVSRFVAERARLDEDEDEGVRVIQVEGNRCRTLFGSTKELSA